MFIRSMIMTHILSAKLVLTNLESKDIAPGNVQIVAKLNGYGKRRDEIAETLIQKISGEHHVTSVG